MKRCLLAAVSMCVLCILSACGGGASGTTGGGGRGGSSQFTTHFAVTAPATASVGTPFSITVLALDASNKTVAGYSGTVHLTSSDRIQISKPAVMVKAAFALSAQRAER